VPGEKHSVLPVFTLFSMAPLIVLRSSLLGATVTSQSEEPASVDDAPPAPASAGGVAPASEPAWCSSLLHAKIANAAANDTKETLDFGIDCMLMPP
jgi:hypothetical protein